MNMSLETFVKFVEQRNRPRPPVPGTGPGPNPARNPESDPKRWPFPTQKR